MKGEIYSKIQHIIIYESLGQRFFGLSSVSIETAREGINSNYQTSGRQNARIKSTGPLIPDLNKKDAEKLKNKILVLKKKYSRSGI